MDQSCIYESLLIGVCKSFDKNNRVTLKTRSKYQRHSSSNSCKDNNCYDVEQLLIKYGAYESYPTCRTCDKRTKYFDLLINGDTNILR